MPHTAYMQYTAPHAPQLMIKGKNALPPKSRRIKQTWGRSDAAPFRRVKSLPTLIRVACPKDDLPPPRRARKRPPSNEEIFGLLQDIQADIFKSTGSYPAEDLRDGATSGSSILSPLELLPLSPLMHPQLLKARQRYTDTKPLPSKDLTEFQTTLARNPYAKTLASPVRSKPWLVPKGLEYLAVPGVATETTSPPSPSPTLNADISTLTDPESLTPSTLSSTTPVRSIPTFVPPAPTPRSFPSHHSTAYLTTQFPALAHIASLKSSALNRHLPLRWKTHFGPSLQGIVCRDDLADFVLSLLRKHLGQQLLVLGDADVPYLVPYSRVKDKGPHQLGAVLWVGETQKGREAVDGPEAYMTTQVRGEEKVVPVYNLRVLLGVDGVRELKEGKGGFDWRRQEMVGVKIRARTMGVLGQLWRLMGYLGGEGEELREWRTGEAEQQGGNGLDE
ncbi:hypothetical protein MMC11_003630 [Xylographa trunciseda]|nr:hypothetical protein [Xylographa trunciseda]